MLLHLLPKSRTDGSFRRKICFSTVSVLETNDLKHWFWRLRKINTFFRKFPKCGIYSPEDPEILPASDFLLHVWCVSVVFCSKKIIMAKFIYTTNVWLYAPPPTISQRIYLYFKSHRNRHSTYYQYSSPGRSCFRFNLIYVPALNFQCGWDTCLQLQETEQ